MSAQLLRNDPLISLGQQSENRHWVAVGSTRSVNNHITTSPTKLLFNKAIPASVINRATTVDSPAPIVIERLLPQSEIHDNVDSIKSSISFTTLSEERLQAAIKLAKRDLRRRHLESLKRISSKPLRESSLSESSDVELLPELGATLGTTAAKVSNPKEEVTQTGVKQHMFKKNGISSMPHVGQSPPTRDPGLKQVDRGKQAPLSNEICKLQNELERYIQKVEELANRGEKMEEPLEPEQQSKLETRRQKQAARSARVIYVLQQQVKEIQDDIEKLRKENMWDTKKSLAINRLAAAHRGTIRFLQVFIHQLSDLSHNQVPLHYKELGQLIRQLSLCSAKVEVDWGSAVPEMALDILEKLEILDSALSKHEMLEKIQAQAYPPRRKSPHRSVSPTTGTKSATVLPAGPFRPTNPRRDVHGRRQTVQKPKAAPHQRWRKREVVRFGLQAIAQQRELREQRGRVQANATCRREVHAERRKPDTIRMQDAGFRQPTVSSQLRVNQVPQKEQFVPWMPTSPHSPPQQRKSIQSGRPEPRCLFSPVKTSSSPPSQNQAGGGLETELMLSSAKKKDTQNKVLRKAALGGMTLQKLKELHHPSKTEAERIHRSRSEVVSQNQWANGAEQKDSEIILPPSHEKQDVEQRNGVDISLRRKLSEPTEEKAVGSAGRLSEALLDDLLEDAARVAWAAETDRQLEVTAQRRLQAPTLESMLLRMEEIQRDEEEVRRRFASITYSDPLYWDQSGAAGSQCPAQSSRPSSPEPIRLTRPVLRQSSAADIILEKPIDTGFLFENTPMEETFQDEQLPTNKIVSPGAADRSRTAISVPGSTLRNIRRYQDDYDTYLRAAAHRATGSFNPWAVADSLADELLLEALADVTREFQDVVEEYAEAVFTSEFLRPIQSPPSAAALVGQ